MSDAVTLLEIRTRVREIADLGPDTTSGRYPNSRLNREINISWQRGREIGTMVGNGLLYLKTTGLLTMTAGAVNTGANFGSVPLPADCVSVHGIDVVFSTNDIRALEPVSFQDRNSFKDLWGGPTGQPAGFQVYNIGVESGAAVGAGTIAVFPAPDRGYSYQIWYLPVWVDKSSDTDVFDAINGHADFAVWDTVIRILSGDNDSARTINVAMSEREKAEKLLSARVNRTQRVGPARRRDVYGESRRRRAVGAWRLV